MQLSWRHPKAWKQLNTIELRLLTRKSLAVGEVTIRPRTQRISAAGAVKVVPKQSRLARKGKTVSARLALRLDQSLAGQRNPTNPSRRSPTSGNARVDAFWREVEAGS